MQVYNFYKEMFKENLELFVDFVNSVQEEKETVEKKYERSKKKPRLS
jgi:hypothetical protein